MENLSRDSVDNIARYLPGKDRLSLALCSKSSFEGVRRKLEFKVLAREQPEAIRILHKRWGRGPGRENFVKWMISGNGEVVVVVDWNFKKREIVVDRIGIPENKVSSSLLIQSGGYGGHFSAELSYSGTILAIVAMDYYNEQRDLFDLHICRVTSSKIHVIASHMLNEATAEIVFSRSEKYIAVAAKTKALILSSGGETLFTKRDSSWINLRVAFTKREELLVFSNDGSRTAGRESSSYQMRMSSPPFDTLVRLPSIPGTEQGTCRARLSSNGMLIVYYEQRQLYEVFDVNAGSSGYRSCLRSCIDSNIRITPFMPNLFISYEVVRTVQALYLNNICVLLSYRILLGTILEGRQVHGMDLFYGASRRPQQAAESNNT
ncbi:hypothetical protein NDN08_007191 [Rhodosorus marinus]|uniref:F-box domain-containing protein n=1 Tax=Rhodosorus marinus TaxID=101924 RepID=A0AAV8UFT1_9RHOD|nr:hypothetical protein NDN08_007191 [Rhodosorus marinus]